VKVPTGGKPQAVLMELIFILSGSPRALNPSGLEVSRSGVIPGPTVKVRMGESNDSSRAIFLCLLRYFFTLLHGTIAPQ